MDRPPIARERAGAVALLEHPAQLDQVEGLPAVAVRPVGVEADPAAFRQDDEQVAAGGELGHVGRAGPATVRVAAAVQQVEHRPSAVRLGRVPGREQQAHTQAVRPRAGEEMVRSCMRSVSAVSDVTAGCAGGGVAAGPLDGAGAAAETPAEAPWPQDRGYRRCEGEPAAHGPHRGQRVAEVRTCPASAVPDTDSRVAIREPP